MTSTTETPANSGRITITWEQLLAGAWAADYTQQPCAEAALIAGREWPGWRAGSPPTWEEVLACDRLSFSDRRWFVVRVLLRDYKLLVRWAADCVEDAARRAGMWQSEIDKIVVDLRAWCSNDDPILLSTLRARAHAIRSSTAALDDDIRTAARAANYAGDAAYATDLRSSLNVFSSVCAISDESIIWADYSLDSKPDTTTITRYFALAIPYLKEIR